MDKIEKTEAEIEELALDMETTPHGMLIKEFIDKFNEIVEWINGQS